MGNPIILQIVRDKFMRFRDLVVDADWNCWLLEANAEPDFKQTGERLQYVIEELIEGVLVHALDPIARQKVCIAIILRNNSSNIVSTYFLPLEILFSSR